MTLSKLSKVLYGLARASRDLNAVERSVKTGSPMPILKRVVRKAAGRAYGKGMRRIGL